MTPLINETIGIAIAALMGVAVGMWMRQGGRTRASEPSRGNSAMDMGEDLISEADEIMVRLRDLTGDVQANVDRHTVVIRRINQELKGGRGAGASQVVREAINRTLAANESLQEQLRTAEFKLQHQARQLETHVVDARLDALTELAHRRVFEADIRECLHEAVENGQPTSLMLVDVDSFKNTNELFGFQIGDEVLKQVGELLTRSLSDRESVYRYGGDLFAVLFAGSDLDVARTAAERARDAIGDMSVVCEGHEVWVTASAGLAAAEEGDCARDILHRANLALYASKDAGRDCGHWIQNGQVTAFRDKEKSAVGENQTADRTDTTLLFGEQEQPELGEEAPDPTAELTWDSVSDKCAFEGDITRRLAAWRRGGEPLAVMLIRMDQHDQLCHEDSSESVDRALLTIVHVLRGQLREMDHVARLGESVLGVVLPNIDQDSAILVGERIRSVLARNAFHFDETTLHLTVSIGLIESMKGHECSERLLNQAENALDVASSRGGNRTFVHSGKRVEQVFVLASETDSSMEEETTTAV